MASLFSLIRTGVITAGACLLAAGLGSGSGDNPPATGAVTAVEPEQRSGRWVRPREDEVWEKGEMLAWLFFSRTAVLDTLKIEIGEKDLTRAFLPFYSFAGPWGDGAETVGAGEERPGSDWWRALAVLDHDDLAVGENILRASFKGALGETLRVERRFIYRPSGRRLNLRVAWEADGRQGARHSARVLFVPLDDAPPVDFSHGATRVKYPVSRERPWTLIRDGETSVFLPDGRYRAIATGGPLDSLDEWVVPAKGEAEHLFRLRREVDLPGSTSIDFHVHAAASRDSALPQDERLWSFLAAGVDVLVASDHGSITDYRPIIDRLDGAGERIRSIPGVESSALIMRAVGHWNIWPLTPDSGDSLGESGRARRFGALRPAVRVMAPALAVAEMYESYREQSRLLARRAGVEPEVDRVIIQLNHPRGIDMLPRRPEPMRIHDWFEQAEFDPEIPLDTDAATEAHKKLMAPTAAGTTAMDFDTLEIWNRSSRHLYLEVRRDWFSLLNQGYIRFATANTDTHTLSPELAGYPLNIVFLPHGETTGPATSTAALARAVRAGHMVGTDGPVPLLTVDAAGGHATGANHEAGRDGPAAGTAASPGDTVTAPDGKVKVTLEIVAASWVPVDTWRLWSNGAEVATGRVGKRQAGTVRALRHTVDLHLARDAWVVAEVGDPAGQRDGVPLPGLYGQVAPRALALGFTNPVFIDVDGNGRFDAPGLAASSLPPPLETPPGSPRP